jgi:hypothetical protein
VIFLASDYSDLDRELDRLSDMPDVKTAEKLDAVLHTGFEMTQAAVHVQTGALKASGTEDSEVHDASDVWEGTIEYGSPDDGDGNKGPVDYAIYEKERGVGGAGGPSNAKGDHDFIRPLKALDPLYRAAILEALRP